MFSCAQSSRLPKHCLHVIPRHWQVKIVNDPEAYTLSFFSQLKQLMVHLQYNSYSLVNYGFLSNQLIVGTQIEGKRCSYRFLFCLCLHVCPAEIDKSFSHNLCAVIIWLITGLIYMNCTLETHLKITIVCGLNVKKKIIFRNYFLRSVWNGVPEHNLLERALEYR